MKRLFVAAALLSCALPSAAQQSQTTKSNRPSPSNGQVVYMRAGCYACHGTVGQGGAGTRLNPDTLPLAVFENWVRKGTPGWSSRSGMPAFSTVILTDSELADVYAFLASLPAPPDAKDIPLLNQ
jgi:ubiquinol-cytochrome c reductase cytochrome c subunit